jgi:hypothetical protein
LFSTSTRVSDNLVPSPSEWEAGVPAIDLIRPEASGDIHNHFFLTLPNVTHGRQVNPGSYGAPGSGLFDTQVPLTWWTGWPQPNGWDER